MAKQVVKSKSKNTKNWLNPRVGLIIFLVVFGALGAWKYLYRSHANSLKDPKTIHYTFKDGIWNNVWGNSGKNDGVDIKFAFGVTGDIPLSCDFYGGYVPRSLTFVVYRPSNSTFYAGYLPSAPTQSGTYAIPTKDTVVYGNPGDQPLCGDWNGDGVETIGVKRGNQFFLKNTNRSGYADITTTFGNSGDVGIAGDWDGNGTDTIGVWRSSTYYLSNSNTKPAANVVKNTGVTGQPFTYVAYNPSSGVTAEQIWVRTSPTTLWSQYSDGQSFSTTTRNLPGIMVAK